MKILLTGATGFIGKNLSKKLLDVGCEIHTIVRTQSDISSIDGRAKIFKYDSKIDSLIQYFKDENFDGVIHLASLFLASHTKDDIASLILSNIQFGTELLEASKISDVQWFINTGTFWQNYQNESYNPVNLYAATKQALDTIAQYYVQTSDLVFVTIKLNDTFGPNDTRNKVFNLWNKISQSGEILDMSEGNQIIDISYIDDVVNAYHLLVESLTSSKVDEFQNRVFVVSSNERVTLKELSKIFEEATDKKLNINWGKRPYREREVMIPYEKGVKVPNWKQKFTLKDAIKITMEQLDV